MTFVISEEENAFRRKEMCLYHKELVKKKKEKKKKQQGIQSKLVSFRNEVLVSGYGKTGEA